MKKTELLIVILMIFVSAINGQNTFPLFLKDKNFDVVYQHNSENGRMVKSSFIPILMEVNFNDNTFYLKRDSITIDSRMQYEYFKLEDDKWLEVKTLNEKSTSSQFKVLEKITQKDTIDYFQGYGTGILIFQYYELDTLSNHLIVKKEIQH